MNNINFYEVIDSKGRWMGSYSKEFDRSIDLGIGAFEMARINAIQSGGTIFSVSEDGERTPVWTQ